MIVAEQKPIQEILSALPEVDNLLVVGCDTCVTICLAGGEKEVRVLCAAIRMSGKKIRNVESASIERQCDREFLGEIAEKASRADLVLSMACGAGVQMLSDFYPHTIVQPALNTLFMGSTEETGYWLERCLGCGDCSLELTAGICPKTRCSKGLMNGPCGGSVGGKCEVDPKNLDCGWDLIYRRLVNLNRVERMMDIQPPRDWSKAHDGKPRSVIRKDVRQ